ncbi:methyl-accepting chemotaxis protein [Cellvibrio sp. pealriver]|uniref:methyl-accepting chemotaxis protein n=1 Tax=Cellvibrio sp. pealriver TaxID=1622269 RepID=UPI00066FE061|nr:methyl-accepting chemotaxis protein [Cellvibrio sp. pealriver]
MAASWSLRKKISTSVAVSLLLVGCAVSFLSYVSAMKAMENNINRQVAGISATFSKYVSDWFELKGKALEGFPANATEESYNAHLTQVKVSADVDNSFLAFADGRLFNANNLVMAPGNDDPRVWHWYIHALERPRETTIESPTIASATGKNVVSLGRAVINSDGSVKAILGIDVVIDDIVQQLRDIDLPGNGYMFIARGDKVFSHADQKLLNKPLLDISADLTQSQLEKILRDKDELHLIQLDGKSTQVFADAIPGSNLVLVMVLDRELLVAPVHSALMGQLAAILVLLVAILVVLNWFIGVLLKPLHTVSQSLSDIASGGGDLSRRLPLTSHDEVGLLAANFNSFVDHMSDLVKHIRAQANDLQDNARAMADSAVSSVRDLGVQQQQIGMVAQAMNEMTSATHEIAHHAEHTADSVRESVSSASEGKLQVDKTRDSIVVLAKKVEQAGTVISTLNNNAQNISGILATIQGIAEQTNLLALNAAIEAARAGEQGRGFAVVADEVRVLSQRTHASTEEIQSMIGSLQSTAQNAVSIMEDSRRLATGSVDNADSASHSLDKINSSVGAISGMAVQIATAAEEQSQVVQEVLNNITAIKQVADNSAASALQGDERAKSLQDLARGLNDKVSTFRL